MKKLLFILPIIFLFLFSSESFAFGRCRIFGGGCVRSCGVSVCDSVPSCTVTSCYTPTTSCYTPPCYTPPTIVPVQTAFAYPLLVPAYQFQYVPPAVAVPVAAPVVPVTSYPGYVGTYPVAPVVPITPSYAYPTYPGPQMGAPPIAYGQQNNYSYPGYNPNPNPAQYGSNNPQFMRELAKALLEEMSRQSSQAQPSPQPDSGPPPLQGYNPPAYGNPPYGDPNPPPANLQQEALSILAKNCAACHTGLGANKGVQIFLQPGLVNSNVKWNKVRDEIAGRTMPPPESQWHLTEQEINKVIAWIDSIRK